MDIDTVVKDYNNKVKCLLSVWKLRIESHEMLYQGDYLSKWITLIVGNHHSLSPQTVDQTE